MKEAIKIFRYYWPHVKEYRWSMFATLAAYGFGTFLSHAATPLIYKRIIDIVSSARTAETPEMLIGGLVLLVLSVIVYNVCYRVGDFTMTYTQSNILKSLADEAFARVSRHSYSFFADTFVGSLVAKTKRYVDSFETLHDTFIFNVWMNGTSLLGALTLLFWFAPLLSIIYIGWLVIYTAGTVWFIRRGIPKYLVHATAQSKTTGWLADMITNILTIKMFARLGSEENMFGRVTADQEYKRRSAWQWANWQKSFQGFAVALVELAVMSAAVMLWLSGDITAGTIVLAQIYLFILFDIAWNMGRQITRTVQAVTDAKEMIDIFEAPIAVSDIRSPEQCQINAGNIVFENVSFKYGGETSVFENFSLTIPAGQKVGLVGHSGAGKTTVTKLLLRFADVNDGVIKIDGQDIARIKQDDLRSAIAYVPQEPVLFHRTLAENISYGKPRARKEDITKAAKSAHADEFISKLAKEYKTLVGERGIKLSGGERQRIAIARAMLKDAPILILDEATSSLDSISERHIQDAFQKLMKGRTTLVIAHRLSTIQKMDRILVFDAGRIVEDGTHDELIKHKGMYYDLWREQVSGFIGE
jgi:ATP-binding cassette subfamily B protein